MNSIHIALIAACTLAVAAMFGQQDARTFGYVQSFRIRRDEDQRAGDDLPDLRR